MNHRKLKKILLVGMITSAGCAKMNFAPIQKEIQQVVLPIIQPSPAPAPEPTPENIPQPTPIPIIDPTPVPTPETTPPQVIYKNMSLSQVVAYGNKQVDFLLVFDDSNSMLPSLKKLAASLGGFIKDLELSNIDWQMCMTTTGSSIVNSKQTWGTSFPWIGYTPSPGVSSTLLKKGVSSLDSIFINTVNSLKIGIPGSGDERGIKAAYQHLSAGSPDSNPSNGCYRNGAALSVILVSNEDERSLGGDKTKLKSTDAIGSYQPLETEDLPENLQNLVKTKFGSDIRFTFNSIIVKPNDSNCELLQDQSCTSPSHPGTIYSYLSQLTDGGIGSICDSNFSANLNIFKDKIVNSMSNLTLSCAPIKNSIKLYLNNIESSEYQIESTTIKFNSPLMEGTKIDINFNCEI